MTLKEAQHFIENLKSETTKNSEIKVYNKFLQVLTALQNRTFTTEEMQSLETALNDLNLESNSENRKRFFSKAFDKFENYLKETLSLTSNGYYTNWCVSLGVLFGVVGGILVGERFEKSLGISFGICMGLIVGAYIGRRMDAQAKAAGKML